MVVEPARLLPGTQLPHRQRNPTQKTTQRNGKGGVLSREEYYLLAALSHHWHHHHHHHHHITDTHTHIHALLFNFFSSPHTGGALCCACAWYSLLLLVTHSFTYIPLSSLLHSSSRHRLRAIASRLLVRFIFQSSSASFSFLFPFPFSFPFSLTVHEVKWS